MRTLIAIIALVWGWNYLLDGEKDMCQARTKFVARQGPYALEILAARHPLSVGLVRSFLNGKGELDQFLQSQIQGANSTDSSLACAIQTTILHFGTDQLRTAMADNLETGFGIKDAP